MAADRPERQRGQATVEHAALALLVAVVLGAAAVAADALGARSQIGAGVQRQLARAICLVGGGGATCEADREPCLVRSDADQRGWTLQVSLLRIGRTTGVVVDELSDGTFRVTEIDDLQGGLALTHGSRINAHLGAHHLLLGGEIQAAVLGHLGGGDSWTLRSRREVDELVRALRQREPQRPPDAATDERGWSVTLGGTLSRGSAAGGVTISAREAYGSRVDRATGRRTVYVRPSRDVAATLTLAGLQGRAEAGGSELYGVTVDDASGAPVELSVMQTGSYGAAVDLPVQAQAAAGLLGVRSPGAAREYSVETRLPLTTAADRALAAAFIDQVLHPDVVHVGDPVEVSRALERRLAEAGIANARLYALDEGGFGVDGRVGMGGVTVGGSVGIGEGRKARLLAAGARGPDGGWYRRDDCLRGAPA